MENKLENPKEIMQDFINKLNNFMKQTNEILETLILEQNNIKVDIDKLKKKLKEKESLIITGR
jgi:hypothetical protein